MNDFVQFISTYNPAIGMPPVSVLTTIFGGFCVTFTLILCWGKLVEDFGPMGGGLAAAFIVGTFWIVNHKLPGFGINPECLKDADGVMKQFGLVYQGYQGNSPWVDMGTTICIGLWVFGLCEAKKGEKMAAAKESAPRVLACVLGGAIGGAILGLVGWTGANLFGYK
ncbi:MAG TPA: hypothetical protein VGP72_08610 [Planctomycetota bacterium]|jgi:hypothetical protein